MTNFTKEREMEIRDKYREPLPLEKTAKCQICDRETTEYQVVELGQPCSRCIKVAFDEYKDEFTPPFFPE